MEKIIVTLWSYGNIRGIYSFWPQWNKSRKRKYLGQIWQIFDQRTNMARISTSKMQFVSDYITFLSTFKRFLTNFWVFQTTLQGRPYVRKRCILLIVSQLIDGENFFLGPNERYISKLHNDTNLVLIRWVTLVLGDIQVSKKTLNSPLIIFYENWHDVKILIGRYNFFLLKISHYD